MNIKDACIRKPVLVLGIGNILLHDEGIGVYVIEQMQKEKLPSCVELLDGGTAGADLLDYICDRQKVIVIDAIDGDYIPGTIIKFTPDEMVSNASQNISMHEIGFMDTLLMSRQLNCEPKEVVIIGIKPENLSCGLGLSDKIATLLPVITKYLLAEIAVSSHFAQLKAN